MAARIEVYAAVPDSRAEVRKRQFKQVSRAITEVRLFDSYVIDAKLTAKQLKDAAAALANPTFEKALVNAKTVPFQFTYAIEIGFLPGVTDNVGHTAKEVIGKDVYTSRVFFLSGAVSEMEARQIADTLYNPLIERASVYSYAQYVMYRKAEPFIPKVKMTAGKTSEVNLQVSDAELVNISRKGTLALDLPSMQTIRDYFKKLGRNPNDIELESLAQTWSEHCKHTIFANPLDDISEGIYKKYIKGATNEIRKQKGRGDFCLSVFKDNSGAIVFDDEYAVTHKVETHNTPSMLDPFGGAITGILGVNRDTVGFGLGAKPVLNYYGFCFADPRDTTELYRDKERTKKVLSAERIMKGVIAGINSGGNCSGIATPQGFISFHPRFRAKPLVFAGTVGIIPRRASGGGQAGNRDLIEKQAKPGDYVVMLGGRVGADGIHGATFSSVALDANSPATAVQIGDPITQKKMSDAIVKEARDLNLYTSITDNGAGGLSCSVAEMARESGGFEVELSTVPLKYPGLSPWQIWISESQERMTLAVPPKQWNQLQKLMASRGVEATRIGTFTDSGKAIVKNRGKIILDIDLEFLHEGVPMKVQMSKQPHFAKATRGEPVGSDFNQLLLDLLAKPGITSTAFVSRQYDHEVQGVSVTKPLQGRGMVSADATVSRPVLTSQKGVVMSQGLHPTWTEVDAYKMAGMCIDTAIRNAVAAGADPDYLAILDNFCWSSSDEPERLYQLKEAARGCYDYAVAYGTPFISGKDSMFNDFSGFSADGKPVKISVPPTLLISALGVIPDITKAVTLDLKSAGDVLYIVGEGLDAKNNLQAYRALYQAIQKELVASAIGVNEGGLLVALAKTAIAGDVGINVATRADLLSAEQGRIVVSVAKENAKHFEKMMAGNSVVRIGEATSTQEIVINKDIKVAVVDAAKAYHETFKNY